MTDGATAQATASSPRDEEVPPDPPEPVLPDWDGAGLHRVVPTLLGELAHPGRTALPDWFPEPVAGADQVVLLVLDGLGEEQLRERVRWPRSWPAVSADRSRPWPPAPRPAP